MHETILTVSMITVNIVSSNEVTLQYIHTLHSKSIHIEDLENENHFYFQVYVTVYGTWWMFLRTLWLI